VASGFEAGVEAAERVLQASINTTAVNKINPYLFVFLNGFNMELLASQYLRAHASTLRAGCFFLLRVIFQKTRHALLFSADDADVKIGLRQRRLSNQFNPLLTDSIFMKFIQFTNCNLNGIYGKRLLKKMLDNGMH